MKKVIVSLLLTVCPIVASEPAADQIAALREQIARQQAQIDQLRSALDEQKRVLDRLAGVPAQAAVAAAPKAAEPVTLQELERSTKGLAGFEFSGDFRFRADIQARSGNEFAPPLQNARSRYRLRLNIDKELDPRFRFHMQLATGPLNNPTTTNQDMAGMNVRPPFSLSEAHIEFRPNKNISIRGGRMEEVLADRLRFLWDDDVRFNGFDQKLAIPLGGFLGLKSLELRAGEYFLSNPAVYVLSPNSPYVNAGYEPGQKVRSANLFHPGFLVRGDLGPSWSHSVLGGVEIYRNPDQIQLASTGAGVPVLVNGVVGVALSGPVTGAGNATTTPGGAMYSAPDFHIAHAAYRLERKGVRIAGREMPLFFDFQAARNVAASELRDSVMASANLGSIRQAGDMRFLYQFAIKDANSMISQFTDDNLGTGSGVNIAVHAVRFDLGLTRFLQFQNILFMQNQRRGNNPARQFFVPLPRGANQTTRYLGQLAFTF